MPACRLGPRLVVHQKGVIFYPRLQHLSGTVADSRLQPRTPLLPWTDHALAAEETSTELTTLNRSVGRRRVP